MNSEEMIKIGKEIFLNDWKEKLFCFIVAPIVVWSSASLVTMFFFGSNRELLPAFLIFIFTGIGFCTLRYVFKKRFSIELSPKVIVTEINQSNQIKQESSSDSQGEVPLLEGENYQS